jgi:tRNA(Ile)-lysidine synthase
MASTAEALEALSEAVRASGLIEPGCSVVVMTSGGPDSACAAAGVAEVVGAGDTHALHLNYSLRETADRDERVCRQLCAKLRIDLHVERPTLAGGNLQAAAREARYVAAERLRRRTHSDFIVTGHTRTDLAETVLYRLAVSPGSRALLGLAPQSGRVVRPLLALERRRVRELAKAAGLPFADDETNLDPAFARNRIRGEVLPVLRELSPAAERNLAETRMEIAEEARLLDRMILSELEAHGSGAGAVSVSAAALAGWDPALRRLALRALAERAAGRSVPLGRDRAAEITRLAADPEGGEIQLGGGLSAICESGLVRFVTVTEAEAAPTPVALRVPGRAQLGRWEVKAELHPVPLESAGPELATLDAAAVSGMLEVRTWRDGDRIRPLGMSGTKTLQDLFTDRGVPRTARRDLPVVTVDGAIAWVAGVAVSEDFRLGPAADAAAVLSARVLE